MSSHLKQANFTLTYVRPNSVCGPQIKFLPSSKGMLKNLGRVQWTLTKMVRGLEHMASDESLREYCTFGLPSSMEPFSRGQWPQVLA